VVSNICLAFEALSPRSSKMHLNRRPCSAISVFILAAAAIDLSVWQAAAQSVPAITVNSSVPNELNPPFNLGPPSTGGAPAASPEQASAFAWQEFIALNWVRKLASQTSATRRRRPAALAIPRPIARY
jgi:hypothetical protein